MRTRFLSLLALTSSIVACSAPATHRPTGSTDDGDTVVDASEPLRAPQYRVYTGGKVEKKTEADLPKDERGRSMADGAAREEAAASAAPMAARPPSSPAPGDMAGGGVVTSVKSGEWNDNANYQEFVKYLGTAPTTRAMDVKNRRFIQVTDADGMAVANCAISIHGDGKDVELVTASTGRALLFPHAEGLGGRLRASTSCAGSAETSFDVSDSDGLIKLAADGHRELGNDRVVDIVFVLDTTGSMSEEIAALVSTIERVTDMLEKEKVTGRFGLVEFKDRSDQYITRTTPMTRDVKSFLARVKEVRASGGGDLPEDVNEGVRTAIDDLAWSKSSVARLVFLIGDAPPHLEYQDSVSYADTARKANHQGIVVHTVAASGMDDMGQSVFRQLAQYTGGDAMFVLRGGAGPSSTGGGDPKSSCGGTQKNFRSGELHRLITDKVYASLKAVDGKPTAIAGLSKDEDAKPCAERIAPVVWQR